MMVAWPFENTIVNELKKASGDHAECSNGRLFIPIRITATQMQEAFVTLRLPEVK